MEFDKVKKSNSNDSYDSLTKNRMLQLYVIWKNVNLGML